MKAHCQPKLYRDKGHEERRSDGTDVGAGIEDAGRQCAFLFWKPFRNRFHRAGKIAGLAERQS